MKFYYYFIVGWTYVNLLNQWAYSLFIFNKVYHFLSVKIINILKGVEARYNKIYQIIKLYLKMY